MRSEGSPSGYGRTGHLVVDEEGDVVGGRLILGGGLIMNNS